MSYSSNEAKMCLNNNLCYGLPLRRRYGVERPHGFGVRFVPPNRPRRTCLHACSIALDVFSPGKPYLYVVTHCLVVSPSREQDGRKRGSVKGGRGCLCYVSDEKRRSSRRRTVTRFPNSSHEVPILCIRRMMLTNVTVIRHGSKSY